MGYFSLEESYGHIPSGHSMYPDYLTLVTGITHTQLAVKTKANINRWFCVQMFYLDTFIK